MAGVDAAAGRSLYRRSRVDLGQLGESKHRTWVALPVVFVRGVPTPAVLVWFVSELHPSQQFCRARREFVDERPERLISAVTGLLVLAHNGSPEDSGVPAVDCSSLVGQRGDAAQPAAAAAAGT